MGQWLDLLTMIPAVFFRVKKVQLYEIIGDRPAHALAFVPGGPISLVTFNLT